MFKYFVEHVYYNTGYHIGLIGKILKRIHDPVLKLAGKTQYSTLHMMQSFNFKTFHNTLFIGVIRNVSKV